MAKDPGNIGGMGLEDQFQQIVDRVTADQTPGGIEDHHPFIADQFFFAFSFHENFRKLIIGWGENHEP
jgi:hypothetical protein